jgi:DNA mismatch repair protein MutS
MSNDSQQISFLPSDEPQNKEVKRGVEKESSSAKPKVQSISNLITSPKTNARSAVSDVKITAKTKPQAHPISQKTDERLSQKTGEGQLSPLMRQYYGIKERNPDTILLYRMGDFYELFDEDAKIGAAILGITLTARGQAGSEDTPLAGFPYHALDRYANKLVKAGYKIAICEQIEDPKQAKGIVKRDVVEVISIGTATEDNFIEERVNNFIAAVYSSQKSPTAGLAVCDLSTGFFQIEEFSEEMLEHELVRIDPGEVLISSDSSQKTPSYVQSGYRQVYVSRFDSWKFEFENACEAITSHFEIASVQGLGLEGYTSGICAGGALIRYLKEQKKNELRHITTLTLGNSQPCAELDPSTIRNLELFKPMQSDDSGGTLISVLDRTSTSMGARMLRRWLSHPLRSVKAINERLDSVEWFKKDTFARGETEVFLKSVADLERLISKVTFERANGRDLNALKNSFITFPYLQKILKNCDLSLITNICADLSGFEDLVERIGTTLVNDPPLAIKEGGMIRNGISATLDELHDASTNGKQWIARLQETERQRTGISSLKVGYNRVFGYYIEVTSANSKAVPADYIRKQTLTSGERYITPELKEMEDKILGAQEKIEMMEYEIFVSLRKEAAAHCERIQRAALAISTLDVFVSLGRVAAQNSYCRPKLDDSEDMLIREGRHPVVEQMCGGEQFVPNDAEFTSGESQIMLITGPNMAGKSTYLRQNALIAIMAQMGSFVPAASAQIGIVDKFFTRIGASDRLARGQSTFLVEMIEVANILNNASDKSFVLLDEVGRGTSTFDGISIAWAVAEYLHESVGRAARTLFATHYHELTEMSLIHPRIKNLHVKVKEWNDQIIFLRKIDSGSCDHSYGIQVARLAGVPTPVILRAREILNNLENMELTPDNKPMLARSNKSNKTEESVQLNIIASGALEITTRLKTLDINSLTPIDALNILSEMRRKAVEG